MNGTNHPPSLLGATESGDLASNNQRLILTRWIAGVMVLLATAIMARVLGLNIPERALYIVGLTILAYNAALSWYLHQTPRETGDDQYRRIRRVVLWQIGLDWLSMGLFLHLTGGIASPAVVLFFIHVVMVAILLPDQSPYLYVVAALFGLVLVTVLESTDILPHYTLVPGMPHELYNNPIYILSELVFMAIGLFATAFVASSIMARLRIRERQIEALLQTAQDVNSTLDLDNTLERLAFNAAAALSVYGASIRLLNASGDYLRMVASYGLSRMYLDKGPVALSQSQLDREALSGQPVIICDPSNDPRVQYPEEIAAEGILSLMAVPIIGQRGPLGVLRVYSRDTSCFNLEEAEFINAIAQQGAIAIENALAHNALTRADEERAQFVRIVTHELRAPITGAQSLLNLLSRGIVGTLSPEQQDIANRMEKRFELLLTLISDLLAFAAGKAVEKQEPLQEIAVAGVVEQVADKMRPQALEKGVTLSLAMPDAPLVVRASEEGLVRILDNLIGNAIKYTRQDGLVHIVVEQEANCVRIAVMDTGIGIPPEEVEKLGREFYRATNARESEITGTGLGLAIVKQLIERFGGMLSIQSAVGEGSTFTVTLPLHEE